MQNNKIMQMKGLDDSRQLEGVRSYISHQVLIVPFQADFYIGVIDALGKEISNQLCENSGVIGVIIDVSEVNIIDLNNIKSLEKTLYMAELLGVQGYISGLKSTVVLALINIGYDGNIKAALDIEQAMELIHQSQKNNSNEKIKVSIGSTSDFAKLQSKIIDSKDGCVNDG